MEYYIHDDEDNLYFAVEGKDNSLISGFTTEYHDRYVFNTLEEAEKICDELIQTQLGYGIEPALSIIPQPTLMEL